MKAYTTGRGRKESVSKHRADPKVPAVSSSDFRPKEVKIVARFYGTIQGNRGMASRMGGKDSGISGHLCGWRIGIRAFVYVDETGKDTVGVYLTGGSNGSREDQQIAKFHEGDTLKAPAQFGEPAAVSA